MALFNLQSLAEPLGAHRVTADAEFDHVSIDTRSIEAGECFIAIKGPNFDGHEFVQQAKQQGAVAAIVSEQVDVDIPQCVVEDTTEALGTLGALRREQLDIPIIAVTGSCGKTTAKAMMASILNHCGNVHAGKRSFNNHFGVPLTLLEISHEHEFAVIEMGANHSREIAALTAMVKPTVAAITIAAPVHLEGFGDLAGVARAKGEIFQGLNDEGVAVINADDCHAQYWHSLVENKRVVTFGLSEHADVRASNIKMDQQSRPGFTLHCEQGQIDIQLPLIGEHNITNALVAAACTLAAGASLTAIHDGLCAVTPVAGRMIKRTGKYGSEIYDDCYNANPVALNAALKVLSQNPGKKILVLGEMSELGEEGEYYHRQLAQQAIDCGVDRLYAVGDLAAATVQAFGNNGFHFHDKQQLIDQIHTDLQQEQQTVPMQILVKGSRTAQLEQVVETLLLDEE